SRGTATSGWSRPRRPRPRSTRWRRTRRRTTASGRLAGRRFRWTTSTSARTRRSGSEAVVASRSGAADGGHHRLTASVRRHPADPDPVRATKARAVWWLGLTAAVTGPLLGGVVPAAVALILAGQFRREAYAAGGFLTGAALVRRGE